MVHRPSTRRRRERRVRPDRRCRDSRHPARRVASRRSATEHANAGGGAGRQSQYGGRRVRRADRARLGDVAWLRGDLHCRGAARAPGSPHDHRRAWDRDAPTVRADRSRSAVVGDRPGRRAVSALGRHPRSTPVSARRHGSRVPPCFAPSANTTLGYGSVWLVAATVGDRHDAADGARDSRCTRRTS